jgi:hypothetical protein
MLGATLFTIHAGIARKARDIPTATVGSRALSSTPVCRPGLQAFDNAAESLFTA